MQPSEAVAKEFEKLGIMPPTIDAHGSDEEIRANIKPLEMTNWRLEGNILKCDTPVGEFAQRISPDLILSGVDENNKPIFTKVTL